MFLSLILTFHRRMMGKVSTHQRVPPPKMPGNPNCVYNLQANTTRWKLDVLPKPSAAPPPQWIHDKRRAGDSAMVLGASGVPGGANGALKEYLLRITRTQEVPANASPKLTVEYRTPLSYLFIGALNCSEEWQGFGDPVFDPSLPYRQGLAGRS